MRYFLLFVLSIFLFCSYGADKKKRKKASIYIDTITMLGVKDTTSKSLSKEQFKSIKEVTEKTIKINGLFNIYQDTLSGKIYLEISEDKLGKEFIYFQQVVNGVIDARYARGGYQDNKIFAINRYFDRIDFEIRNTDFYFDPANALSKAADANINQPLFLSEKILASSFDSATNIRSYLIDGDGFFFKETISQIKPSSKPGEKSDAFKLGSLNDKKNKYTGIFNYPENTDVQVAYVFDNPYPANDGSKQVTDARFVTVEVRHCLIAMPDNDYIPRKDDPRVGYFMEQVNDMTSTEVTPYHDMIHRWNLQRKDTTAALSEPVKPIVWWIGNTTPVELRPIIKDAALQWNLAFESAGFKNALEIYEQPDSATWDAGDIRYNVIRWVSSPQPPYGGFGPSFVNPRTGEILGADIMLEWVYLTNRVQLEALYEKAGTMDFSGSDEHTCQDGMYNQLGRLYGSTVIEALGFDGIEERELLKHSLYRLVLHELGHTLGLNHNFAGSLLNTTTQLQDKNRAASYGLCSSVMDYTPPNISRDSSKQGLYYDVIPGPYDHWAIEYGYRQFNAPESEDTGLEKIISRSTEPANLFFNDADDMRSSGRGINPQAMIFDMSADPIGDAIDKMEIIKVALDKIKDKFAVAGDSYHKLRNAYLVLTGNYATALQVISRYIGGINVDRSFVGQQPNNRPFIPVAETQQKRAMQAMAKYAFSNEAFDDHGLLAFLQMQRRGYNFSGNTEDPKELDRVLGMQKMLLDQLFHPDVLRRIISSSLYGNTYALNEVLADLTNAVFKADISGNVNFYRQNLQAEYLNRILDIVSEKSSTLPVIKSATYGEVEKIRKMLQANIVTADVSAKNHRLYLLHLIQEAMDHN